MYFHLYFQMSSQSVDQETMEKWVKALWREKKNGPERVGVVPRSWIIKTHTLLKWPKNMQQEHLKKMTKPSNSWLSFKLLSWGKTQPSEAAAEADITDDAVSHEDVNTDGENEIEDSADGEVMTETKRRRKNVVLPDFKYTDSDVGDIHTPCDILRENVAPVTTSVTIPYLKSSTKKQTKQQLIVAADVHTQSSSPRGFESGDSSSIAVYGGTIPFQSPVQKKGRPSCSVGKSPISSSQDEGPMALPSEDTEDIIGEMNASVISVEDSKNEDGFPMDNEKFQKSVLSLLLDIKKQGQHLIKQGERSRKGTQRSVTNADGSIVQNIAPLQTNLPVESVKAWEALEVELQEDEKKRTLVSI